MEYKKNVQTITNAKRGTMADYIGRYFKKEKYGKAYQTEEEYLKEQYKFLDLCLEMTGFLYLIEETGEDKESKKKQEKIHIRELPGTLEDAYASLIVQLEPSNQKVMKVRDILQNAKRYIESRIMFTPNQGRQFKMQELIVTLKLSELEQFMLVMAYANSYDEKYEKLFVDIQGRDSLNHPTFQTTIFLFSLFGNVKKQEIAEVLQQKGILIEYFLDVKREVEGKPKTYSYALNKRTCSYFYGYEDIDPNIRWFTTYYSSKEELQDIYIRQEMVQRIKRVVFYHLNKQSGKGNIFHIYGSEGNGKKLFLRYAAKQNGKGLLIVDIKKIENATFKEVDRIVTKLICESILLDAILCFFDDKNREEREDDELKKENFPQAISYLIQLIGEKVELFFWISNEKSQYLLKHPLNFQCMEQPMLSVGERIILWKKNASAYLLSKNVNLLMCANQYILSIRGIQNVLQTADFIRIEHGREEIDQNDIQQAVKQLSPNQLGRFATLINAVYSWEDLVVSERQKQEMKMICNQLKYKNIVGEEWGFFRKTAYGRGICALFYGSPGTGKTMAVQVMANELGLDLYRVDLSQLVSKYIGETEKNISTLFKKAKNINALLFFDEADSLFAKRSEVKDSHDRNANAETAHLLQKLEDYEGITILATNYVNNIDDAFKRRIKFMVNFSFPNPDVRLELWKKILPSNVPCEEELDFEFYAEKFELSGSSIKEILTNAAFLAAAQGENMANRHLIEAIKVNFSKYGKILTDADFEYLI